MDDVLKSVATAVMCRYRNCVRRKSFGRAVIVVLPGNVSEYSHHSRFGYTCQLVAV